MSDDKLIRQDTVGGLEMFAKYRQPVGDTSAMLDPCKQCGHEAMFVDAGHKGYEFGIHVECTNTSCGIRTPPHYKDRESAAKAWNRKAP